MQLIQAKVCCAEGVSDTGWFVPGRETTVIFGPPGSGKAQLLNALQALNPLYEIVAEAPFAHHPEVWNQGAYMRRVIPQKKTTVFMVFSAEPTLVRELDEIDPALIETDRIEVGRRLDYSRWITFVEISASTRWSEIAEPMFALRHHIDSLSDFPEAAGYDAFFTALSATDRIKGDVAIDCRRWLNAVATSLPAAGREVLERCQHAIGRAERFALAREKVEQWLPPTICLRTEYGVQSVYAFSEVSFVESVFDPVQTLLHLLCQKYHFDTAGDQHYETLSAAMENIRSSLSSFLPAGYVVPRIRVDGKHLFIDGESGRNVFKQRLYLVSTVCLLSELCYGRRPLLLLDRFDRDLSTSETLKMVEWLQKFGGYCQLILTTESEVVLGADDWQAVRFIGRNGLATDKLVCE